MDFRILDTAKIERELAYYRRECNDLGGRLLRLQEEQSQAFREARRSRTVAKLIREAHRLVDLCATPDEIGASMLEVIVENTLCDRAAFLRREGPAESSALFRVTHAFGFGQELALDTAIIPAAPAFFLTTSRTVIESPAYELTGILRLPYILWAFDRVSGHALILGNQSESNVSRPFENGDQELVEGALSVYIDVLMRKQAENELRAAKATAEEASALRARFIATLSHELRTPLNAVIGFSDMLMPDSQYQPTAAQRAEYAQHINSSGRLLLNLINDILDYSSLSQVAPQLDVQWCDAETLLGRSVRELSALAIQNGGGAGNRRGGARAQPVPGPASLPAGAEQPGRQRAEIHRQGGQRRRLRAAALGWLGRGRDPRHRHRHADGGHPARARTLPAGGWRAFAQDAGHGPRPADRQGPRGGAWRAARDHQRARPRHHGLRQPAAIRGAPHRAIGTARARCCRLIVATCPCCD
jgi:hypothetical protein